MRPAQEGEPGKVRNCGHERMQTLQSLFAICAHRGLGWSTLHRVAIVIFLTIGAQPGRSPPPGRADCELFHSLQRQLAKYFQPGRAAFRCPSVRFCHHGRAIFHMFRSNVCETDLSK